VCAHEIREFRVRSEGLIIRRRATHGCIQNEHKGGGLINAKQIGVSASAGKHNAADGEKFTALNAPINAGLELIRFLHLFSLSSGGGGTPAPQLAATRAHRERGVRSLSSCFLLGRGRVCVLLMVFCVQCAALLLAALIV
jgi:hypothetical protein